MNKQAKKLIDEAEKLANLELKLQKNGLPSDIMNRRKTDFEG